MSEVRRPSEYYAGWLAQRFREHSRGRDDFKVARKRTPVSGRATN
jgi:hypothetical protein